MRKKAKSVEEMLIVGALATLETWDFDSDAQWHYCWDAIYAGFMQGLNSVQNIALKPEQINAVSCIVLAPA